MNRKSQRAAKLIRPDDRGHSVTFECFSALILHERLEKIEITLAITSPSDGFRRSLIRFLWHFYCNSLPEAATMASRAVLKRELRSAAVLSEKLEASAARLWKSTDPVIGKHLHRFAGMWQPWQSARPTHPSGIAWIDLINEFALTTRLLADTLTDDSGGPRPAMAFDHLVIGLADYHRQLGRNGWSGSGDHFFRFIGAVVDVLRNVEPKLPAARFKLPHTDRALRMRLHRLASRRVGKSSIA